METIELAEGGYVDAWICICGNQPHTGGFYPCSPTTGALVEPEVGGYWDGVSYRCDSCGRVIDQDTGAVVVGPRDTCGIHQGGFRMVDAPARCDLYDAVRHCGDWAPAAGAGDRAPLTAEVDQ